jgi:hypothetical protein
VIYLKTLRLEYTRYDMFLRGLRHILRFYGPEYPLETFDGKIMLQYADLYPQYSLIQPVHERSEVFWKFMFFLKKNDMIPSWTEPERRAGG